MSLQLRRVVTVTVVSAALLAVLPAPAHAIPPWELGAARLATRFWGWLEELGLPGTAAPAVRTNRRSLAGEKQGSMIDPNGSIPQAASSTEPDQGSMIDPNGND